jgi:hypothetical protein
MVETVASLSVLEEDIQILLARENPNDFCRYVMQWDQQDFHEEWQGIFYHPEWNPTGHPKALILGPRDHGKSSQLSIARVLWELGKNHDLRIKLIAQSDEKAADRLFEISDNLRKNERLHKVFPALKPALEGTWTKHKIIVERSKVMADASVEALGITSTATGGRADLEVFDDPIDFRNAIQYPAMRKVVKKTFYSVWINLLEPEGRMIYIGTAWHLDDLTHELMGNPAYYSKVYKAIQDDGRPLWGSKWSLEQLMKRMGEIGEREFQRQFLNVALSADETLFPLEPLLSNCFDTSLEFGKMYPWIFELPRYVGVDLAVGTSTDAAYTVIFVIAWDAVRRKRIPLEIVRKRMTAPQTVRELFKINDKWSPKITMVENNAYQQTLIQWMHEFDPEKKMLIKPFTTLSKADPETGLPGLSLEFEQSGWIIPRAGNHSFACQCPICLWLEEMETYPIGRSKDILMASWFASEPIRKKQGTKTGGARIVGSLGEVFNSRSRELASRRNPRSRFTRRSSLI